MLLGEQVRTAMGALAEAGYPDGQDPQNMFLVLDGTLKDRGPLVRNGKGDTL